jgi:hypothetical protein
MPEPLQLGRDSFLGSAGCMEGFKDASSVRSSQNERKPLILRWLGCHERFAGPLSLPPAAHGSSRHIRPMAGFDGTACSVPTHRRKRVQLSIRLIG